MGEHRMDISAAEAAKRVKRTVISKDAKSGEMVESEVAVKSDEVLACAVRGADLVVVTTDGQKLVGAAPAPAK